MKIGIHDVSLDNTPDRMFDIARNLGFDGVELSVAGESVREHPIWTRPGLRSVAEHRDAARVEIPSIMFAPFGAGGPLAEDGRFRDQWVKLLHAVIPRAASLGVAVIHVPSRGQEAADAGSARDGLVTVLRDAAAIAERYDCMLALGLDAEVSDQLATLKAVGSDTVGLDFDTADSVLRGHDVREFMCDADERLVQMRLRDVAADGGPRPLGLGTVDFTAVADALDLVDYGGYLLIDTPSGDDPVASAAANLAFIQEMLLLS